MKTLQNYIRESSILEAKNDNLHEFIQYLNKSGKRGQLKSKYKKEDIYPEFIADLDIMKKQPSREVLSFAKLKDRLDWDYMHERDVAHLKDIENDDFADWFTDKATKIIMNDLKVNNNNCIYIERAIGIPTFSDKDNVFKGFKKRYNGHLGVCWAYKENFGRAYDASDEGVDIVVLKGYVRPEDVNWRETVATSLFYDDECELRLIEGAPVQLTEVLTDIGEHKIFCKNLILKA